MSSAEELPLELWDLVIAHVGEAADVFAFAGTGRALRAAVAACARALVLRRPSPELLEAARALFACRAAPPALFWQAGQRLLRLRFAAGPLPHEIIVEDGFVLGDRRAYERAGAALVSGCGDCSVCEYEAAAHEALAAVLAPAADGRKRRLAVRDRDFLYAVEKGFLAVWPLCCQQEGGNDHVDAAAFKVQLRLYRELTRGGAGVGLNIRTLRASWAVIEGLGLDVRCRAVYASYGFLFCQTRFLRRWGTKRLVVRSPCVLGPNELYLRSELPEISVSYMKLEEE